MTNFILSFYNSILLLQVSFESLYYAYSFNTSSSCSKSISCVLNSSCLAVEYVIDLIWLLAMLLTSTQTLCSNIQNVFFKTKEYPRKVRSVLIIPPYNLYCKRNLFNGILNTELDFSTNSDCDISLKLTDKKAELY